VGDRRWLALTLAFAVLLVTIHVWWLVDDRRGFPLDIDEAGYMTIALNDHAALAHGGLPSYWHAVESQYPYAPLVPALTAFVYLVRTSILASYAVELAFLLLLAAACYGVAARLAGPRVGSLAALAALTAPGVIGFSREYLFALPSAALLTCAVYSLLRSDALRSRRWAAALGASLGLMLLARTMSVAVLPAVLLAGAVRAVTVDHDRLRSGVNLGIAVVVAVGIAAIWYLPNLTPVFKYLSDYGYGTRSGHYGTTDSVVSLGWWTRELHTLFAEDLYAPLGLLALAGLASAAVEGARRLRAFDDRRTALLAATRSDAVTVAIVLVGGYFALSSSRNRGFGFALMLVPLLLALAAHPLRLAGRALPAASAVVGAVAVVNVVASTDVWPGLSQPRNLDIPALGSAPLTDGEGLALAGLRRQLPGDRTHFTPGERDWPRAAKRAASWLIAYAHAHGGQPIVAFGIRNRVFNTNTVALAARLYYDGAIPMAQLDPLVAGDNARAYAGYLVDPRHGQPNFLLTASSAFGDFTPTITQTAVIAAARIDRFMPVRSMTLPDGRIVTFWWLQR
jgi:4-amino-4-deoxy-L-arabinose transferase-like glycosyltransferase